MRQLRLLCATDLSEQSNQAVQRAMLLSEQLDAELMLFHAIDPTRTNRLTRRKQVRAQLALSSHARQTEVPARHPRIVVRVGQHQSAITEMAREWDADLIILGARTERFGESIVGTTAERVSRKARRPILVVNRDVAGPAGASMLRVSGVSEPAIQTYVRTMSQSTSHEILQQFEHAGVHTERMSVLAQQSSPLRAIEHAAQLTDADLVVVGSRCLPARSNMHEQPCTD